MRLLYSVASIFLFSLVLFFLIVFLFTKCYEEPDGRIQAVLLDKVYSDIHINFYPFGFDYWW